MAWRYTGVERISGGWTLSTYSPRAKILHQVLGEERGSFFSFFFLIMF